MKFYSYTNKNNNYTKAISLENIRSISIVEGSGKSVIRFSLSICYIDNEKESLAWLEKQEAEILYKAIVDLLNK
jgi:hypothetical protein